MLQIIITHPYFIETKHVLPFMLHQKRNFLPPQALSVRFLFHTHTHFVSSPPAHQLRFFCSLRLKIIKLEVDLLRFASLLSHPDFSGEASSFFGDSRRLWHLLDIQTYIQALGKSFLQLTPLLVMFWTRFERGPKMIFCFGFNNLPKIMFMLWFWSF